MSDAVKQALRANLEKQKKSQGGEPAAASKKTQQQDKKPAKESKKEGRSHDGADGGAKGPAREWPISSLVRDDVLVVKGNREAGHWPVEVMNPTETTILHGGKERFAKFERGDIVPVCCFGIILPGKQCQCMYASQPKGTCPNVHINARDLAKLLGVRLSSDSKESKESAQPDWLKRSTPAPANPRRTDPSAECQPSREPRPMAAARTVPQREQSEQPELDVLGLARLLTGSLITASRYPGLAGLAGVLVTMLERHTLPGGAMPDRDMPISSMAVQLAELLRVKGFSEAGIADCLAVEITTADNKRLAADRDGDL